MLWNKITSGRLNELEELLPQKRKRKLRQGGHEYRLPRTRTQRFENSFINRCLFKLVPRTEGLGLGFGSGFIFILWVTFKMQAIVLKKQYLRR